MWTNVYSLESLGRFLQQARRERGVTQKQMAGTLGFSPVTLSTLETGKNVSAEKVERYLQMLGFSHRGRPEGGRRGGARMRVLEATLASTAFANGEHTQESTPWESPPSQTRLF